MAGFLNRVRTEDWRPGEFVVVEPLHFLSDSRWQYTVPRGFITDFASIPRPVRALPGFDVNGDSRRPAVLHDFLYCCRGRVKVRHQITGELRDFALSRKQCDALFLEALESVGMHPALAALYWSGVRAGGWLYWHRRADGLDVDFDFVGADYFGKAV